MDKVRENPVTLPRWPKIALGKYLTFLVYGHVFKGGIFRAVIV